VSVKPKGIKCAAGFPLVGHGSLFKDLGLLPIMD